METKSKLEKKKSLDKDYELVLHFLGREKTHSLEKSLDRDNGLVYIFGWGKTNTTNGLRQTIKKLLRHN